MKDLATATDPLLASLAAAREGPNVVAIGGGHGLAKALEAVSRYAGAITAVVTVADDGGSSGRLTELGIPPPGDIRQCLLALAPEQSDWHRVFAYRFSSGSEIAGHSLGNLVLAALTEQEGSFAGAVRRSEQLLGTIGSVVPASPVGLELRAIIDGEKVEGQVAIALRRGRIEALTVAPLEAEASEDAVVAIAEADQIVLGPGSHYTSLMAALVVPGIVEAINQSPAKLIYVANLTTQDGETLGMDCADHLQSLLEITGIRQPSTLLANSTAVQVESPLEALAIEADVVETYGVDVVLADVVDQAASWPGHDAARLGGALGRLVPDEPESAQHET